MKYQNTLSSLYIHMHTHFVFIHSLIHSCMYLFTYFKIRSHLDKKTQECTLLSPCVNLLLFEKSTTELKYKQKLLKCKSAKQIVTFNVRTLNRIGQLPELRASRIEHNRHSMGTRPQITSQWSSNKIPRYWQWVDVCLSISMEKLCQRRHRGCRNTSHLIALRKYNREWW